MSATARKGLFFFLKLLIIPSLLLLTSPLSLQAQEKTGKDTAATVKDTLLTGVADTTGLDTVRTDTLRIKVSNSAIKSEVKYQAKDSLVYDLAAKRVTLYNDAKVNYEQIELKAASITYGFNDNKVFATSLPDSSGAPAGRPVFTDNGQNYESDTLRYNFKTRQGSIKGVYTTFNNDGHIYGKIVKKDTNDVLWIKDGKFCPCEDKDAKTQIRVRRIKVIPQDKIVTGAGVLTLSNIPTPLVFPFGFFPNNQKRSAGILIPTYGEHATQGFFLMKGGYYQPLSDHVDLQLTGDVYSKGSYTLRAQSQYNKLYKSNGNLSVVYYNNKTSFPEFQDFTESRNYEFHWKHNQDLKARPNTTFSSDVTIFSGSTYKRNLSVNLQDYFSNKFFSSVNYGKSWSGKPYNLNINASLDQNTLTKDVILSAPNATFALSRIYLSLGFLKAKNVSTEKWYEKLGLNYTANFNNTLKAKDSQMRFNNIDSLTDMMRNGINHQANLMTSIKAGYFSLNPGFRYTERWYFNRLERSMLESGLFGEARKYGFYRNYDYGMDLSLSTQLFGMYTFRKTRIAAIRHLLSPSVSVFYRPKFDSKIMPPFGYPGDGSPYNPYTEGIFGSANSAESGGVSLGLSNSFEMKVKTPRDTAQSSKKVPLLEAFNFNASYDMFKDSLRWSDIQMEARTSLSRYFNLRYAATYSPYNYSDSTGEALNTSLLKARGKLVRMRTSQLALAANLGEVQDQKPQLRKKGEKLKLKDILPIGFPVSASINYTVTFINEFLPGRGDSLIAVQVLNVGGKIQLLRRLGFRYTTGWDFLTEKLSYTQLNIYVDMNCWELSMDYVPIGERKNYSLRLNMKSAILKDVKLERRRTLGTDQYY